MKSKQKELLIELVASTKRIRILNGVSASDINDIVGVPRICERIEQSMWVTSSGTISMYNLMTYLTIIQSNIMVFNDAPEEEVKERQGQQMYSMVDDFFKDLGSIFNKN